MSVPAPASLTYSQSFQHWLDYRKLVDAEVNLLSLLECFPEADATRKAALIDTDIGGGNLIHEFCVENTVESATPPKDVVIIHGYGAALGFFYRNVEALSELYPGIRLHFIDLLGFGFSSRPAFPKPVADGATDVAHVEAFFIDSIEAWRHARGIDVFTLIGHSFGGYLGSCYAMRYPSRVDKLVLVSPVGVERSSASLYGFEEPPQHKESMPPTRVRRLANYLWKRNVSPFSLVRYSGPFQSKLVSMWSYRRFGNLSSREIELLHLYSYKIFASPGSGEYALTRVLAPGAVAKLPLLDRVPTVFSQQGIDTLWIYGDRDWMNEAAGEECVREIVALGGRAEFVVVADAGHHVYLDNPDGFAREVERFLHST